MQNTHEATLRLVVRAEKGSLLSLAPTWRATAVEDLEDVLLLQKSCSPDSRTRISFWSAASRSDNIY